MNVYKFMFQSRITPEYKNVTLRGETMSDAINTLYRENKDAFAIVYSECIAQNISEEKLTLHTKAFDGGAFNCRPAMSFEMLPKDILINDVVLPGEYNPHNVRLWVIGHEHGAIVAVWAAHAQDAFDNAVDANRLDMLLAPAEDCERDDNGYAMLGNAGEAFDLDYAWIAEVEFNALRDSVLLARFHSDIVENLKSNSLEY